MRTGIRTMLCLAVAGAACAPAASTPVVTRAPLPSEAVWLQTDTGLRAVDVATGRLVADEPRALAANDWSGLYSYRTEDGVTSLTFDPSEDTAHGSAVKVPGRFVPSVVSGSGRFVALTEPRYPGATAWVPDGRRRTTLVVADGVGATKQRFELRGNFEPEAFSTDDRRLYTIEYIPAWAPNRYRVRILHLATGKVSPIGRLKTSAPGQMRGTGRMQVLAPGGAQLYTLYTKQGPNYAHGAPAEGTSGNVHAFVHVLNLREGWAHCIDLPAPFGTGSATAGAIALSLSGHELYVVDWSNGAVALVEPHRLEVARTTHMTLGGADDRTFAAVAPDGTLYAAGNNSIVGIDGSSLEILDRWELDGEVSGLATSADSSLIYAVVEDRLDAIDVESGRVLMSARVGAVERIAHVGLSGAP